MVLLPLAVVESWQAALDARDHEQLAALTAHDIELVGPRGTTHGAETLHLWLHRAGFSAQPLRWFCGPHGDVVVEQRARWTLPDALLSAERTVASAFRVRNGRVVRYQRFDTLDAALSAVRLTDDDEVIHRA